MEDIYAVQINWFYTGEVGEEYRTIRADNPQVSKIQYSECMVEGDKHFVDVFLKNGGRERHFNINTVTFKIKKTQP